MLEFISFGYFCIPTVNKDLNKYNKTFSKLQQKRPSQRPVVARSRDTYAPTSKNIFPLSLRLDHFSNETVKSLGPMPPILFCKIVVFLVKFNKNHTLRHLRWLVSDMLMHRLHENISLLSLRQDHFSN